MRQFVIDSFKAGIMIGFGCITFALIPNHILGSALFSLGLLTICFQTWWLYTGRIGSLAFDYTECFWYFIGLIFNLLGITLICYLFNSYSGLNFDYVSTIVNNKITLTWYEILIRAIGCGAMMEIAVSGYKETKNPLSIIMPVMVFILCGFEHCIADMGYMTLCGIYVPWIIAIAIIGNTIGAWIISKLNTYGTY